jgi:hypothetical protein
MKYLVSLQTVVFVEVEGTCVADAIESAERDMTSVTLGDYKWHAIAISDISKKEKSA